MKHLALIVVVLNGVRACFPTSQRQYQYGAPTQQFQPAPAGQQYYYYNQQAVAAPARAAAAGKAPTEPISTENSAIQSLLGRKVSLTPFDDRGYNSESGGPVNSGDSLSCNFDDKPCCWANVPPPDDQLDWQVASGTPNTTTFPKAPSPPGHYLISYAKGVAPSDEAQLSSCSIGCSSSPITVRAKHWQSNQVLLQACLRESFVNAGEAQNPLLHCQTFPTVDALTTTEVILPKASLVDVVFVASNFVAENGDIVILDDIEVFYETDPIECPEEADEEELQQQAAHRQTIESTNSKTAVLDKIGDETTLEEIEAARKKERQEKTQEGRLISAAERFGNAGFKGGNSAFTKGQEGSAAGSAGAAGSGAAAGGASSIGPDGEETIESIKTAKTHGPIAKGTKTKKFSESVCLATKCDFERGNTCNYKDAFQTESAHGTTTGFQVAEGQFMNRVTGVKESSEGDYYAATFLYPHEKAGLEVSTETFTERSRIRFRYYEGTHGVQLKGCCSTIENCPFGSDKFVSLSDRMWKTSSFKCPKGTDKVIFLCENLRTNQGACAVDDIGMVELDGPLATVRPLC